MKKCNNFPFKYVDFFGQQFGTCLGIHFFIPPMETWQLVLRTLYNPNHASDHNTLGIFTSFGALFIEFHKLHMSDGTLRGRNGFKLFLNEYYVSFFFAMFQVFMSCTILISK